MSPTDQELVGEALAGNQRAFTTLVERHRAAVHSVIYRVVKNTDTANDLVQETFIKAFSSLTSYRPEYKFSTWLYKIAVNSSIDLLRRRRLPLMSLDTPIETEDGSMTVEIADHRSNPEVELERKQQEFSITAAIDDLPERYKEVIQFRHQDDKSYEEIAEMLKVPVGTVKARIFRAREMLKRRLKDIERL